MVPGISLWFGAANAGIDPAMIVGVVDVPVRRSRQNALGAEDVPLAGPLLVYVKLQRLRSRRILHIEIGVVHKVRCAVVRAEVLPPDGIGIRRRTADVELQRASIQRRGSHGVHRVRRGRTSAAGAGAARARLPAAGTDVGISLPKGQRTGQEQECETKNGE